MVTFANDDGETRFVRAEEVWNLHPHSPVVARCLLGFKTPSGFHGLVFRESVRVALDSFAVLQRSFNSKRNERECRRDSHPDDDARFASRGSRRTSLLEIVRGGFLQRLIVRVIPARIAEISNSSDARSTLYASTSRAVVLVTSCSLHSWRQ